MRNSDSFRLVDEDCESSQEEEIVNIFLKNTCTPGMSCPMSTPSTHFRLSGRSSFHHTIRIESPVEQSQSSPFIGEEPVTPLSNTEPRAFSFKHRLSLNCSSSLTQLNTYSFDSYNIRSEIHWTDSSAFKTPELKVSYHCGKKVPEIDSDEFEEMIEECRIIDCRWPYEFEGGSIKGAINCYDAEELLSHLLVEENRRKKQIFFCEYSQVRGPKMARFFINYCVKNNVEGFKDVYVLKGGFNEFYSKDTNHLTGGYVIEKDIHYSTEMRQYSGNGKYDMNIPPEYEE